MGFNRIYYEEMKNLNLDFFNKKFLELGDQEVHDLSIGQIGSKLRKSLHFLNLIKKESYKVYDLHDVIGVTKFDLSIIHENLEKFDIITNFGTTEHVELEDGQYNCWLNIHNMLNIDGVILSIVPCDNDMWPEHCRYYYTENFFKSFEQSGYSLIKFKIIADGNCLSLLKKENNCNFMLKEQFWKNIVIKNYSSDIIDKNNNPKNLKF